MYDANDSMIDSSMAVDQSISNFDDNDINSRPIPVFEDVAVDLVPDVEANAFVQKVAPIKRTFTLRLNIGIEGEDKREEELP